MPDIHLTPLFASAGVTPSSLLSVPVTIAHIEHRMSHCDITRCKAWLDAQGFMLVTGVNYKNTFTPIAKFSTLCVLLVLTAHHDSEVHQM